MLLLSTDEEISNDYLEALRPALLDPTFSIDETKDLQASRGLLRMRSPVETVRVSARGRESNQDDVERGWSTGMTLPRRDCRCFQWTPPPRFPGGGESSVEMEWKTFAGAVGSELSALILLRATADGIDVQSRDTCELLRSHLERGISLQNIRSIAEMVDLSKS